MNSCELTASITVIANYLASKYNDKELGLLASVLVQLGDTLVTISLNRELCNNNLNKKNSLG